jgi:hypothetical protein
MTPTREETLALVAKMRATLKAGEPTTGDTPLDELWSAGAFDPDGELRAAGLGHIPAERTAAPSARA